MNIQDKLNKQQESIKAGPSDQRKRVLLVEDDEDIVGLLEIHIEDMDCHLTTVLNGSEGLEIARNGQFDLIILDIMLPGKNGIEICETLRKEQNFTPILMLSAKSEKYDKIIGMELGADAYMTKPFRISEFITQTQSLLCEARSTNASGNNLCDGSHIALDFGNLRIVPDCKEVFVNNELVKLSCKEFDLLLLLVSNPGKQYSRSQLYSLIWGFDIREYEYVVNSHINRLRKKIELNLRTPAYIKISENKGYYFDRVAV